jgi:DNA-binding PadR family transcriptional regulator
MNQAATDEVATEHEESGENTTLNTLGYIILGLLWTNPMSGYDIKTTFDRIISGYWNAGNSQIYSTLKSLSGAGLVEAEMIVQTTRPNRKVYRLTAAGHDELTRWLEDEVPERFSKDEFLAKLFFCGETSDEAALHHLQAHRTSLLKQLEVHEWANTHYSNRVVRRPRLLQYQMLVGEYKEATLRAGLEVTERAIAHLQEKTN